MKLRSEQLEGLVTADDPVERVWETLWDVWSPPARGLGDHFERETESMEYEYSLWEIYREFYQDVLPERCVTEPSIDVPDDGAFLVMDSMSVREAPLFVRALEQQRYRTSVDYSFATVPSETTPFRERVSYDDLKREHKTVDVTSQADPSIDGDEDIVWSRFPDSLLETIQEGKTELSTIEEAYQKTEDVLLSLVEQVDGNRLVIGSDHGYVRLEAGYSFPPTEQDRLKDVFSQRFVSVGETTAEDLVDAGVVAEEDGYYLPVGRFTWPARGKYSTYQHGGTSLVECLTPRIEVTL